MDSAKQHDASAATADPRYPNTPIGIVHSRDAFLRDLPELLANPKYDRWSVVYCGDERIGIAEFEAELIRECNRRGLRPDQYFIGCIFPHATEEEEEIDFGLAEFEEYEDPGPNDAEPTL